jgi:hypothetical protein
MTAFVGRQVRAALLPADWIPCSEIPRAAISFTSSVASGNQQDEYAVIRDRTHFIEIGLFDPGRSGAAVVRISATDWIDVRNIRLELARN